jgi:Flp pilus assembly protein TadG
LVESAIVYSLVFIILFGIILGATAILRYQQVAHIAREASRWAAVHGESYAKEQNKTAATAQDVYDHAVLPQAASMDPSSITLQVSWDRDKRPYHLEVRNDQVIPVTNNVSVTVEYRWDPGFLFGPFTLRSTSVSSIHY